MANILLEQNFIDDNYYLSDYRTAFSTEWNVLTTSQRERYIKLASNRIQRLIDRPIIELDDVELEQVEGIKQATAQIIDYWMEYGLDLNRISGSVSLGTFSASQQVPNDPDYIPEMVYETLQKVNLYTPIGYLVDHDIYRADQEQAITYGVRFATLERVKWVSLDKATVDANNKELHLPTTKKVNELISKSIKSIRDFLGEYPTTKLSDLETDYDTFLKGQITEAVQNGDTADIILNDANSPYNGEYESYTFENGNWRKLSNNINDLRRIIKNENDIKTLNSEKLTKTEAEQKYFKLDGSSTFTTSYTPSQDYQATTVKYVNEKNKAQDVVIQGLNTRLGALETNPAATYISAFRIWTGLEDGTLSPDSNSKQYDLSGLNAKDGSNFSFVDGQDITLWIKNDDNANTFNFGFDVKIGDTPQMIEIVRQQGSNDVIALFAKLETNGTLTLTRNATTNFDLTNIKVLELKEAVLAQGSGFITNAQLINYQTKQDQTLTTSNKNIVGAINELDAEVGSKQSELGLKLIDDNGVSTVIKESGVFSSKDTSGNRQKATQDDHLIDLGLAKDTFQARTGDYTSTPRNLTFNETGGKRFQIIDQPSGEDTAGVGVINKLILNQPTGGTPTDLPQDTDQITYGSQLYWIKKSNGDIVNWSEIKDNVSAKKIMVIKKITPTEWELVGWEDAPYDAKAEDAKRLLISLWDNEVVIPKGEVKFFNEVKTGTKFEDSSLFTKTIIADGQAILGGTDFSTTKGSVGELPINKNITLTSFGGNNGAYSPLNLDLTTTGDGNQGCISGDSGAYIRQKFSSSGGHINIGKDNYAAGIKIVKVSYTAKKDITRKEMV